MSDLYRKVLEEWSSEALHGDVTAAGLRSWAYAATMLAKAEWHGTEGPSMLLGSLPGGFTFGVIRRDTADGPRWEVHS